MRPSRLLAVAWRERARSASGRRGWGLLVFSLLLLLPASALRLPSATAALPEVSGEVPAALSGVVRWREGAPTTLSAGPPLVVRTRSLAPGLREALVATETRPAVRLQVVPGRLRLPGRALLVALLAISMLTGPLAETLPGEREGRTLEVLLSTSLSRRELVVGKWLWWTASASAVALLAGGSGVLSGALGVGPWLVAMPAALGVAVALGLWLVRGAGDLVGGAAVPMRVLPVVAVVGAGLAWGLGERWPLLGAAVPLGGALVAASGAWEGVVVGGVAVLASWAASGALLEATARSLDAQGVQPTPRDGGVWGAAVVGGLCWWLAVAGPGVFEAGGAAEGLASGQVALAAGGVLLALVAAVGLAQQGRWPAWGRRAWVGVLVGPVLALLGSGEQAGPILGRLAEGQVPAGWAALVVVVGQELFFRGLLQPRLGLWATLVVWVLVACPADPARGAVAGLALGLLGARWGLGAALVAHLAWVVVAGVWRAGVG